MKIALACDHGGYGLMQAVKAHLEEKGIEYKDFGTYSTASCNYPDFGAPAAHAVANGEFDFGIVICSTGIGMSIVANKVKGIRCALCSDCFSAEMTRRHNNANMLALGALTVCSGLALKIVDTFLENTFDGGRHEKRVAMIADVENGIL